jgi:hypothetical protein
MPMSPEKRGPLLEKEVRNFLSSIADDMSVVNVVE